MEPSSGPWIRRAGSGTSSEAPMAGASPSCWASPRTRISGPSMRARPCHSSRSGSRRIVRRGPQTGAASPSARGRMESGACSRSRPTVPASPPCCSRARIGCTRARGLRTAGTSSSRRLERRPAGISTAWRWTPPDAPSGHERRSRRRRFTNRPHRSRTTAGGLPTNRTSSTASCRCTSAHGPTAPTRFGHRVAAGGCRRGAPAASCITGRPARTCCG